MPSMMIWGMWSLRVHVLDPEASVCILVLLLLGTLLKPLPTLGFLIHGDGTCLMLIVRVKQENDM